MHAERFKRTAVSSHGGCLQLSCKTCGYALRHPRSRVIVPLASQQSVPSPHMASADSGPSTSSTNGSSEATATEAIDNGFPSNLHDEVAALRSLVMEQGRLIARLQEELAQNQDEPPKDARRIWTYEQYQQLPERIVLMRHAKSLGNEDGDTYCKMPDNAVPLSDAGRAEALEAGRQLRKSMDAKFGSDDYRIFFMASPYLRTVETLERVIQAFTPQQVAGLRQEVQLREQDFGNFQDAAKIKADLDERLRYGRFWFRFPNGESGADVFDRMTIFHDHLLRDFSHGRFRDSSLVLITHGITLRIFLMRWFHWTVADFLEVMNPPNSQPVILEKFPWHKALEVLGGRASHVKQLYFITQDSLPLIPGCSVDMASHESRWTSPNSSFCNLNSSMLNLAGGPKQLGAVETSEATLGPQAAAALSQAVQGVTVQAKDVNAAESLDPQDKF